MGLPLKGKYTHFWNSYKLFHGLRQSKDISEHEQLSQIQELEC